MFGNKTRKQGLGHSLVKQTKLKIMVGYARFVDSGESGMLTWTLQQRLVMLVNTGQINWVPVAQLDSASASGAEG